MLEFSIKDVPFYHFSDEIPFLNGTLPQLSLAINGDYVKLLFLVFLLLYCIGYSIISAILFYHWNTYGMQTKNMLLAKSVFTLITLALVALLLSLILSL